MAELSVTRYRFRLARRGWARGEAGQRVAAAARERLPSLVAARLAEVWPGPDGEVSEPVRLRLRVGLRELAAACESDETLAALVARLLPADPDAPAAPPGGEHRGMAERRSPPVELPSPLASVAGAGGDDVARVLLEWRKRGDLAARLESFAEGTLEDWERALLDGGGAGRRGPPLPPADVEAIVRAFTEPPAATRAVVLRRRILAAVEAQARLELAPGAPEIARALEVLLPLPADPIAPSAATGGHPSRSLELTPALARPGTPVSLVEATRDAARRWRERAIESALPFLLLRPLERLGYLDVLSAAFVAAGRRDQLPAFATALAYKVLAPPERGWRRPAAVLAAAAAFAGREYPSPDSDITGLADGAPRLVAPLDGVVARSLLDGHDASLPLLLARHAEGWLLLECDGLFPVAWGGAEGILRALEPCRAPLVVFADAAEPSLMQALDAAGHRFVTDAPPLRGERWRRLQRRGCVLFANDRSGALTRAAEHLDSLDEVRALLDGFTCRRAVTSASGQALERSLELAAGAALGQIAWTLFRHREPPTPRLALERFADLGARLSRDEHGIDVRLPLGRRAQDLEAHRLLGDVRVPWLRGHTVRIAAS
jgi:hypothetical protein